MTAQERAEEITNKFLNMPLCESVEATKYAAHFCVAQIKDSLKTTTDHLTLNALDQDELEKDFRFWEDVDNHIEKL